MPDNTNDKELSLDELKDVSGGVSGAGIEIPRVTRQQRSYAHTSDGEYNEPVEIKNKGQKKGRRNANLIGNPYQTPT